MKGKTLKNKRMVGIVKKISIGFVAFLLFSTSVSLMASDGFAGYSVIKKLNRLYYDDPEFAKILDNALKSAVPPPGGWGFDPKDEKKLFVWNEKNFDNLLRFFEGWLTFVPNDQDGMKYYELLYGLCYKNESALKFLEQDPGLSWTKEFVEARGDYMDSEESINNHKDAMKKWKSALGDKWNDYKPPHHESEGFLGYKTFNEFFTRELVPPTPDKDPRPVAPGENILVSPSDSLINMINSNLNTYSKIHTKYDQYLNVDQLLAGSKYAAKFIGGTAVSCVLLPADYHHYHSPVSGWVVESRELDSDGGVYFGMNGEFFTFSNNDNIGGYKSSFGIFGIYHRGYYIFKTTDYGFVGMIPVGLDDISSVNFEPKFSEIDEPVPVAKGEKVGWFAYGGSTIILLFEPNIFQGLKVDQGMQLGPLNKKAQSEKSK